MAYHILNIPGIKYDLKDFNYVTIRTVAFVQKNGKGLGPPAGQPAPFASLSDWCLRWCPQTREPAHTPSHTLVLWVFEQLGSWVPATSLLLDFNYCHGP